MGSQMIVKCAHCGDCLNRMIDDHAAIPDPGGATYLHAPECHDAYNAARLTDRIAQLTADLAAAKAEAGAYREALDKIADGDVEYHDGPYPEHSYYNQMSAMQALAARTLAKFATPAAHPQVGKEAP